MATTNSCARCGKAAARVADRFCTACGTPLGWTAAPMRRLATGAIAIGVAALIATVVLVSAALGGR
jgi:ribosomal protein L37E